MCILFIRTFDEKRAHGMLSLILVVFICWEREKTIAIVEEQNMLVFYPFEMLSTFAPFVMGYI
jgi:hypothetical protein